MTAQGEAGIKVTGYLMRDLAQQKTYFGTSLSDVNITPCWISLANETSDEMVYFVADDVRMGSDGGTGGVAKNAGASVGEGGKAAGITGTVLYGIGILNPLVMLVGAPFIMVSAMQRANSDEVKRNILSKQLNDRTLFPGESASGFLYIQSPDSKTASAGLPASIALVVPVLRRSRLQGPERNVSYQLSV